MEAKQINFTTPEQAQKLMAFGLPANSADCFWNKTNEEGAKQHRAPMVRSLHSYRYKDFFKTNGYFYIPCWSVARLIEIDMICDIKERRGGRALAVDSYGFLKGFNIIDWCVNEIIGRIEDGEYDLSRLNRKGE